MLVSFSAVRSHFSSLLVFCSASVTGDRKPFAILNVLQRVNLPEIILFYILFFSVFKFLSVLTINGVLPACYEFLCCCFFTGACTGQQNP